MGTGAPNAVESDAHRSSILSGGDGVAPSTVGEVSLSTAEVAREEQAPRTRHTTKMTACAEDRVVLLGQRRANIIYRCVRRPTCILSPNLMAGEEGFVAGVAAYCDLGGVLG